ncbi:adenosine deaminase family protein [Gluconobacter morbifer]|uniref:adenosine deaminase n=1 Tax=Gluconobacter morbifer G707 TaxID=1088869 RepID=G6XMQ4_9PROT|nr:adenosine deaminase [Gluconobacter morbifer]EHH66953.1 adenosine deaminase [Gluconobacter morbifer G707]
MQCSGSFPFFPVALACFLSATPALAQTPPQFPAPPTIEQVYQHVRQDPVRLGLFLRAFPKGADLHNHLAGAVYAENMLDWAARDNLCVSVTQQRILDRACPHPHTGELPATALAGQADVENRLVDAMSMRAFVPTPDDASGHDHFFSAFRRFDVMDTPHAGDMLAEARDRAARDHVTYLELMVSPGIGPMIGAGFRHPLQGDGFPAAHQALAPEIPALVQKARAETDAMEAQAQAVLKCGTSQAHPGCDVTTRYLFQTLRTLPPHAVYAQLDAGYATVRADARFVGLNIVAPEDNPVAMRDYDLHMRMFQWLNGVYPGVKLSLHAGELTTGLVPTDGLRHHIREAVRTAGALRIGHGVDVALEDDPPALLDIMARQHVMVEINLTSNDEILGVKGADHPFNLYRRAGVPLALSTDDEGVSRGDLTQEYLRAVQTYDLSYADIRQLSRNGLEYAFLPGDSLWANHQVGTRVAACQTTSLAEQPGGTCGDFLKTSEKARLQWALETRFASFETVARHEMLYR